MWHKHWTETIYVGQWPVFHGPVILPYILETIWWTNIIIGILDPCDTKICHIKCLWVSDLHFMVQWFCHISWRLFDGGMLYRRYWFSATLSLTCKYICRSVTCILWYSDSALYFQYYLIDKPHSLDIGSDMGHWPVFHDLAILNQLPISAFSGLLKFDMKIFVNVARLEIGQLFTQGTRRGHPCTLDTFLVLQGKTSEPLLRGGNPPLHAFTHWRTPSASHGHVTFKDDSPVTLSFHKLSD